MKYCDYSLTEKQQNKTRENQGFSIITVIVAMAFVGVLVAVIMLASLYNFYSKATNRKAKDNFYSAETALEEIRSGLQIEVDKAFNVAYMSVFQDYSTNLSEKNERFGKAFRNTLIHNLQRDPADTEGYEADDIFADTDKQYNIKKLRKFVTRYYEEYTDVSGTVVGVGVKVQGVSVDVAGTTETRQRIALVEYTDGVRLEGIQITYYDEQGYVSIITTNVLLKVPELDLINPIIVPPLEDYVLIANKNLHISESSRDGVTIAGGLYGGTEGITIVDNNSLTIKRADFQNTVDVNAHDVYAITDNDIEVGVDATAGEADLIIGPGIQVWANAINTYGGNLTMQKDASYSSSIYLQDDLTLRRRGNNVNLSGGLYGFGYKVDGADCSSGIVINGTETTLDLSGLSNLKLAGNTYIATSKDSRVLTGENEIRYDVRTGSSISSKAEQMAYLVPPEYIGWIGDRCVLGTNPVSEADYNSYKDIAGFEEVKRSADIRYRKVHVRTTSGNNWVYFYMRFDNAASANLFFQDYFKDNRSKLNAYIDNYISSVKLNPDLLDSETMSKSKDISYMYIAGNMITGSKGNYELIPYTSTDLQGNTKIAEEFYEYENQFRALKKILKKNYTDMTVTQDSRSVYANVVDEEAMKNLTLNELYFYEERENSEKPDEPKFVKVALVKKNNYIWTGDEADSELHLIICDGNVSVKEDFEGLIIAKGTISIDSAVTVSAYERLNTAMVAETKETLPFLIDESSGDVIQQHMPLYFFVEGQEREIEKNKDISDETYTASDFVIYENWSKQ